MNFSDYPSVRLSIGLAFGIVLGWWQQTSLVASFSTLFVFVILLIFIHYYRKWRFAFPVLSLLCAAGIGHMVITQKLPKNQPKHWTILQENSPLLLKVLVMEKWKPTEYANRYEVEVLQIDRKESQGKLLLHIDRNDTTPIKIDEQMWVAGLIEDLSPPRNPYQFDYESYLKKQGIYGQIRLAHPPLILAQNQTSLFGLAQDVREEWIKKLNRPEFGLQERGIIQALMLGKRDAVEEDLIQDYQDAGAIHLLAVSGLHIGIIALLLLAILAPLGNNTKMRWLRAGIVVFFLWGYAFLTGLSPSVCRAALMFSFFLIAKALARPTAGYNTLAWSFFFLLLYDPLLLFSVGFQLSYAAVLGIIWIFPYLDALWNPKFWVIKKIWQAFNLGIAAQVGVLPLSVFYFHQIPGLFFVVNILIIPMLGLIYTVGLVCLGFLYIDMEISWLFRAFNFMIAQMNHLVERVASVDILVFKGISIDFWEMIFIYGILGFLVNFIISKKLKNLNFALVSLLTLGLYQLYSFRTPKPKLTVAHLYKSTAMIAESPKKIQLATPIFNNIDHLLADIKNGTGIQEVDTLEYGNSYTFGNTRILMLDQKAVLGIPEDNIDLLVLTQSPKINLNRILEQTNPKVVVADGSNYPSFIKRWRATCEQIGISFHSTYEDGAYQVNFSE